jgi:hypothetical protein
LHYSSTADLKGAALHSGDHRGYLADLVSAVLRPVARNQIGLLCAATPSLFARDNEPAYEAKLRDALRGSKAKIVARRLTLPLRTGEG